MNTYLFLLGREPDLSLAELRSIFPHVQSRGSWAAVESDRGTIDRALSCLGGTIKVGEVIHPLVARSAIVEHCVQIYSSCTGEGKKLRIGLDSFVPALAKSIFAIKDLLKKQGHSIRVVQHDGGRVKTATTLHEKLTTQGCEIMVIPAHEGYTIARTLWVQNIDEYTKRDMQRERSMTVGMMPPKLAQIMINLGTKGRRDIRIWDAFCGLGTTLIEAYHGGFHDLIGSDISSDMITATQTNMHGLTQSDIFVHDARRMNFQKLGSETVIVTEGMLGKNFTPLTLKHANALQERTLLTSLYTDFLASAHKNPDISTIVCCLPFWNIGRERIYMPEIERMNKEWYIDSICRKGSRYLIHMRPDQSVGREIVVLRRQHSAQS